MTMPVPLAGQVALVTGASRGIGRAIAERLAADGARVYVNYLRNAAAAAETCERIAAAGGTAAPLPFDVTDAEASRQAVQTLLDEAGRLDILVNNAGGTIDTLLVRMRPSEWDHVLALNLRGAFNCTRAAVRSMIRARYGRVVNVSSVIGLMGNAGQCAYAAAKAGLLGFTKSVARELAGRNITVNAVAPGFIETEMVEHLPEDRRREYLELIPVGRLGTAAEVAEAVAYLVGPGAGYVTGQVIGVNGGLYM